MGSIPVNLRRNGFEYNLLIEGKKTYLYRQEYTQQVKYYEVFKKVIAKETMIQGRVIPERVTFPGNEDFGRWAWTFRDLREAENLFHELEKCDTVEPCSH